MSEQPQPPQAAPAAEPVRYEHADLTPFCARSDSRYVISTPWVAGGWRYAADGRIAVRVPAGGEPDTVDERKLPPAGEVFARPGVDFAACSEPLPTGEYLVHPIDRCPRCAGTGFMDSVHCEECGHLVREGPRCEVCGGDGKGRYLAIGEHWIARRLARLIAGLPGVRWQPGRPFDDVLPFAFDGGGQGVVMGMRKE